LTGRTKTEVKAKLRDLRRDLDIGVRSSATYVDLEVGTVAVYRAVRADADMKTPESRRVLSLPRLAVQALWEHLDRQAEDRLLAGALWQDHGLVFASSTGMPLDHHNVRRGFRRIAEAAGLGTDWVSREMRHTFVSLLSPT